MKKMIRLKKILLSSGSILLLPLISLAQWTSGQAVAGGEGLPQGKIKSIVINLMRWLLILLGAISIIGFVIAGILYLTSAGDEERMEKAKRGMIYSIIGVIVGIVGYVIVQAVNTWLGGAPGNTEF